MGVCCSQNENPIVLPKAKKELPNDLREQLRLRLLVFELKVLNAPSLKLEQNPLYMRRKGTFEELIETQDNVNN
ncbi:hypothetical protein SteCoe_902 [Stentor coeruleus]|uniref:Uncharacterized protein n=1 Tax=Stentor coeruleus TaxID=5963 RepID=A0A1R2D364_9CILI|nr:hypothetical protein SteCoe_902 [Stentor coeruleus]